jgi:hypothetical protein
MTTRPAVRLLALAALCAASQSALATSRWTFSCGTTGMPACGGTVPTTQQYTGTNTTNTAQVSGWAATGNVGDHSLRRLAAATVRTWSGGLGVQTSSESGSPNHAIDSQGPDEFVLVSFAQAVNLTNVGVGWFSGDFDITVLAFTGTGTPSLTNNTLSSADLAGGATTGLVNGGWTLVGNRSNGSASLVNNVNNFTLANNISSSHWLIGAYNTAVGGTNEGWTTGDDYFKLLHVGGVTTTGGGGGAPVPVPGTLALVALGLPLLRRRLAAV